MYVYGACYTSPPHSLHPCPTQNKQISLPQIILTQSQWQITSITTMPPLQHPHTPSLQLHPHTHHTVTPGFVDRPLWSDGLAGQMEGYAGCWTKSGMIGLSTQTRVKGVGRHNKCMVPGTETKANPRRSQQEQYTKE